MARRSSVLPSIPSRLDQENVDRYLARFPEIDRLAHQVYEPEGIRLFLTTPMPRFDGRTALQLLEDGQADRVLSALAADYEGLS
jgi:hypothetical protein